MASFFVDKLCGLNPFHIFSAVARRVFRRRWLRVVFLVFLFTVGSASMLMWAQSDSQQRGLLAAAYVLQALSPPCSTVFVPKEPPLIIVDTEVWANGSRTLSQDLVVQSGGVLYLVNYTIVMNCSSFGEYGITVESGGALFIQDIDFNSSTSSDASVIKALDGGHPYNFTVKDGAIFQMFNSELHQCGYTNYQPVDWFYGVWHGLVVEADYAVIQGCKLTSNFAIILNHSDYSVVSDNYIANNLMEGLVLNNSNNNFVIGNTLENNLLQEYGILILGMLRLENSNNNSITGNDVMNVPDWNCGGIQVGASSDNNTIDYNFVYRNQGFGIGVFGVQHNTFHHNVVFKTRALGFQLKANNNTFTENIVEEGLTGFAIISDSSRNTFINNTANKTGVGFWLEYGNVYNVFINNTAEKNTVSGFLMQGWYYPPYIDYRPKFNLFQNNTVRNNKYGFTIQAHCEHNNFTENLVESNEIGFKLDDSEKNTFSNNRVLGNGCGYNITAGSHHNQLAEETLEGNQYNIYLNDTLNITILNSSFKDSSIWDIYLDKSSELNLFNTSFSTLTINSTSTLNIKNYLRVRVVDSFGNPLPGTDVEVLSFGEGFQEIEYATAGYGGSDPQTDGGGYTPWFLVTNATYPGSVTPVLRSARVYVNSSMVNFPGVPVTVDLVEPQTVVISGVSVFLQFSVMLGLMSAGGSSAPLYAGIVAVSLVALAGVAIYFLRFRK